MVDEAYNTDGTLIEIIDEPSCTTTGFCYSIEDDIIVHSIQYYSELNRT